MWDDEYGELPNDSEAITKNARKIDSRLSEKKKDIKADIGICSNCQYCDIYERELGDMFFKCGNNDKVLNPTKPKIIKCTNYRARNSMSLSDMTAIAWIINDNKKTIKGFGQK